jgi:hypothetical protein
MRIVSSVTPSSALEDNGKLAIAPASSIAPTDAEILNVTNSSLRPPQA